ncbi:MAG: type IV pilus biogenesis protein PilP [Rickettsiales bacterium]|jgi:type IV pilus biogenesis protein PilP|nr:type IV pilus biogenesis protein PilP [Rickettsiales bacterium]
MKKLLLFAMGLAVMAPLHAEEAFSEEDFADVESYDAEGSLFQKIADLEQEKVLLMLEKEKAQLQLDLDRLSAEQTRLVREQDTANARAEEQAAEIEKQKLAIEQERAKLEAQKKKAAEEAKIEKTEKIPKAADSKDGDEPAKQGPLTRAAADDGSISEKYALIEIVGAGSQLFATIENIETGKQKKLSVGKQLDGFTVRSISIDDGVELEKDGELAVLGVGAFGAPE